MKCCLPTRVSSLHHKLDRPSLQALPAYLDTTQQVVGGLRYDSAHPANPTGAILAILSLLLKIYTRSNLLNIHSLVAVHHDIFAAAMAAQDHVQPKQRSRCVQ
jgi:hypothetical protein